MQNYTKFHIEGLLICVNWLYNKGKQELMVWKFTYQ